MAKENLSVVFVEPAKQFETILNMSLRLYLPKSRGSFLSSIEELGDSTYESDEDIPDIIVIDLDFADRDKIFEFLHYIKTEENRLKDVPIITCTVDEDIILADQLEQLGVYKHLLKPFDVPAFIQFLEQAPGNTISET